MTISVLKGSSKLPFSFWLSSVSSPEYCTLHWRETVPSVPCEKVAAATPSAEPLGHVVVHVTGSSGSRGPILVPASSLRGLQGAHSWGEVLCPLGVAPEAVPHPISVPPLEWGDYGLTPKGRNKEIKMLVLCVFTSSTGETQSDIKSSAVC